MSVIDYIRNYPATSCRMHFGDTIIEELIPGYKTNYVSGRDSMMADVYEIDTEVRNFSRFRRRKRLKRELTVGFVIVSTTPEAYHIACNKLKGLLFSLDSDDQEIWFEDESDVFYKGTVTNVTCDKFANISTGGGSITITCSDPRKYAREETEVEIQNGSFLVDYTGTYPSYPILEAIANSELAFISFTNQNNKILQFGNPEKILGQEEGEVEKSEIRFDKTFTGSVPSDWTRNSGKLSDDLTTHHVRNGTLKIIAQGITADSYGTATGDNNVYGVSITKQIPNSSLGTVGAKNWTVNWEHLFYSENVKAWGEIAICIAGKLDGSGSLRSIAEVHIVKNTVGTNGANLYFYINNKSQKRDNNSFTIEERNSITGITGGKSSITKLGTKYTFNISNMVYEFTDSTNLIATEVTVVFNAYKGKVLMPMNALKRITFTSHGDSITSVEDIPNPIANGDDIVADCASGEVTVNGTLRYGLGAIGNDWEEFMLTPGANEIQCLYDTGVTAPEFKMRYREVYL